MKSKQHSLSELEQGQTWVVKIFNGFQDKIISMNRFESSLLLSSFQNSSCLFMDIFSSY